MGVKLYGIPPSAPFRIAYMACEVLGIDFEVIPINPREGQTKTPEYLKINPQHTIPTVVDGDFVVTESRAALTYLACTYDKSGKLCPNDTKARAKIDQLLYFDMGTYYKALVECCAPVIFGGEKQVNANKLERLNEAINWVNEMVGPTGYVAGTDHMTVADISFVATTATLLATQVAPVPPQVTAWFEKCKLQIPNYEKACGEGAETFGNLFRVKVQKLPHISL